MSVKWVKSSIAHINFRRTTVKKIPSKSSTFSIDDGKYHSRKIALEKNLYEFPTATYVVVNVLLLTLGLIRPLLLRRLVEF